VSSQEGRKVETGMSLDSWRKQGACEQRWPRTADCSRVDYRQLGRHSRPWWQAMLAWKTVHRTMSNAVACNQVETTLIYRQHFNLQMTYRTLFVRLSRQRIGNKYVH